MRRAKSLPSWTVDGWIIDKNPNTFAEKFCYNVTAVDADGFCVVRHGFNTKRAAFGFANANACPVRKMIKLKELSDDGL